MLLFLSTDLAHLIKELMNRFIKEEVLRECHSALSLTTVKFADKNNQVDPSKIDIGFSANLCMRSLKLTDKTKMSFRVECRDFLVAMLKKIMEKSPIQYQLVRSLSWLYPRLLLKPTATSTGLQKLDITLRRLCEASRVEL